MSDPVSVGLLILRLILGVVFLAHGVKHALGREKTTNWFRSIGFKAPGFQWMASTATELGVGVMLVLGLGTSLAAAGVIGIMSVAFWTVHRPAGFFITGFMKEGIDVEGYEYVLTLALAAAAVGIAGAGEYSIDSGLTLGDESLLAALSGNTGLVLVAVGVVTAIVQIAVFWRPKAVSR